MKSHTKNILYAKRMLLIPLLVFLSVPVLLSPPEPCAASVTDGASRFRLKNGFTVILKADHSAPVVSVQVWVRTGSANETKEEAGITHLIEHMIFKGTPSRKTGEIARTIVSSGGRINAYTTYDRTVYYVEISSRHFETALDVLLDAVQHSLFDPRELEREKEVVLEEYRRSLDLPRNRFDWAVMNLCYQKHPYGRPVIGYESTIRAFTRNDILKYMDRWYTADNTVLVAVGDFDAARALEKVKDLVKDFPRKTAQAPVRPPEPKQTSLRKLELREKVQQSYLQMCWHIPSLTHADMPALDLLEIILSHGKSSRLYNRLKMKANLVHSIDAGTYAFADPGLFSVDATLEPEELKSTLKAISEEIGRIGIEPVSEAEMSRAKKVAEARFLYDMESMGGQARTLGFFETMMGDMYRSDHDLERMKAVTSRDIRRVVRTYLRPENLSVGIMAPEGSGTELSKGRIMDLVSEGSPKEARLQGESTAKEGQTRKITLANGMKLILKENRRLPVVAVTAVFLGGLRFEAPEQAGLSEFVAKMLTRGTEKRSAAKIASIVESTAGSLEGFSGRNSFGVSAKFMSKDLASNLDLLADVLLHPTFPEEELDKVRKDMVAGIRAKRERPSAELFDLFYKTVYQRHPYGHPQTGTEETIESMKREDLVKWYQALAVPSNFVLAVVGDVDGGTLPGKVEELFNGWGRSRAELPEVLPEPPLKASRTAHLERQGAQTHLAMGFLGADLKSPDNAPMALVETALSGMGGRLFFELRDKKGLAYSVTAFRQPGLETGVFGVYMASDPSKIPVAKEEILKEIHKLVQHGLTEKELLGAKRHLLGSLDIGLQTNTSQSMNMALDELYGLGYDHTKQYIQDIQSVTMADIRRAVRNIFLPDRFVLVTLGPGKKN